jgi:prolipoprotein diacylglyceryl transferase
MVAMPAYIPSPSFNGLHIGLLDLHIYGLMYLVGITVAIIMTRRRYRAVGGDPELVFEVALWGVPAGIIGGRIYFDITTPMDIPHEWYGVFAFWSGGLGIWGGVALATVTGIWRLRRRGVSVGPFMDAVAPGLLIAQGIGRIGNYFNKELFGRPTSLPWGLEIPYQYRVAGGIPAADLRFSTFQPTFLYELIFDFAWAGVLIWLGHRKRIKPPGIFALYVFGYSGYRIFEESLRIDSSEYFLGLRLNMYIACALTVTGAVWFYRSQRRRRPVEGQRRSGAEVGQDGQDAAVVGVGRREPELAEDVADVLLDGSIGDGEAAGDGAVGPALGHQGEDVVLPGGERAQGAGVPARVEQAGDDLGVQGGAARRDP